MMKNIALPAISSLVLALAMTAPAVAGEGYGEGQQSQHQNTSSDTAMQQMQHEGMNAKHSWSAEKRAEDVIGKKVVNSDGDEIGEINKIVQENGGDQFFAVVSVGGFLGIGAKDVTVPLDRLMLRDDQLTAPMASKETLEHRTAFDETQYQEVPGERMVSIGTTGSENMGQSSGEHATTFSKLDSDNNGYLSRQEVKESSDLSEHWNSVDSNKDDHIDRAEFSAFETRSIKQSPMQTQPGEAGASEPTGSSHESGSSGSGY